MTSEKSKRKAIQKGLRILIDPRHYIGPKTNEPHIYNHGVGVSEKSSEKSEQTTS